MNLSPATAQEFPLAAFGQALADFSASGTAAIAGAIAFAGMAVAWKVRARAAPAIAVMVATMLPAFVWIVARDQLADAYIADAFPVPFGTVQPNAGGAGTMVRLTSGQLAVIPHQVDGAMPGDGLEIKSTPRGRYLCRVGSTACARISAHP